ncbi:MAG: ATP phosphoribosyltransferase regulatory subunit [Acidiferrobacterales bacterium]
MSDKDRWLLPEGIEEILPAEAFRLEVLRRSLLDFFFRYGYELVMPPAIEFLESLLTGTGRDLDLQTFKLTDQLSGRMMGVRADMTPQAARIDAHYLKRDFPVRLCYVGTVLHTRPDEFAGSRELLQVGAELFGHPGPESDIEIVGLMLAALRTAGVANVHMDLGHVSVFRHLAAAAQLDAGVEGELFEALQRKSRPEVEVLLDRCDISAEKRRGLAALVDLNGGDEVLEEARALFSRAPAQVGEALDMLQTMAASIRRDDPALPVYFDLAELRGYRYYTGAVFSAFVPGYGHAVAQGGRYDGIGRAFGRARAATGFSADLRTLSKLAVAGPAKGSGILAPFSDGDALRQHIGSLRAAGERVVVRLPGTNADAAALGCDREIVERDGAWTVVGVKQP